MPTGACGINCDACRLYSRKICSSCGSGTSAGGRKKMEAQKSLIGAPCPILACAVLNKIKYCMRDCDAFPCENFSDGSYPFSAGYLNMQKRRRSESKGIQAPYGSPVAVPPEYWDRLLETDIQELCPRAIVMSDGENGILVTAFSEEIRIDLEKRELQKWKSDGWHVAEDPFLELMLLVYLNNVTSKPFMNEMVTSKDLKDAHFFQGPHELETAGLIEKYGDNPAELITAGKRLGGINLQMADAAICLRPMPKIPVYYLLWGADEEFPAKISILFDRSIDDHLSADAIWGIVNATSDALLNATMEKSG